MLTKPKYGWSDFQLEGTCKYGLSYTDDIALEWVEQAIHGLETMLPFCVKGFLEPDRFLCIVSYWNCHIICEDDERKPLDKEAVTHEISHTSMLQFSKYLYEDVSKNLDAWVSFVSYDDKDISKKHEELSRSLKKLKRLIAEKAECFDEDHCFL